MWGTESLFEIRIDRVENVIKEIKLKGLITPKYCIINSETADAIKHDNGEYSSIYGLNIAICEDLKFGEFEIR